MISGLTRLAAVIGDPVRHSLSPAIHNAAFAACGLDWVYVALPVPAGQGARAVEAMKLFGIDGLSVTMPHKAAVAEAADELTESAQALGVSNCLFRRDGLVVGDSTDGDGFVAAFAARFGRPIAGLDVVVAGAGGAARSIVEAVGRAGASTVVVVNRSPAGAEAAAALAPQAVVGTFGDADPVAEADVVVNATALGMTGGPDPTAMPVPAEALGAHQLVIDIVYQPRMTPLLLAAEARGAAVADGVGMLVHQAALAFQRWTGVDPPLATMVAAVTGNDTSD